VLVVSTNSLHVAASQSFWIGQSSTLTKQQILLLIFWKTTSLKELDWLEFKSFYRIMVRSLPLQLAFKDKHKFEDACERNQVK
jgi:hypothetical protein